MAYTEWTPALEVGFPRIDEDHRDLLAAMNRLHEAVTRGEDREELAKVLTFLRDYTVSHFETEEGLMIRSGYPGTPGHVAAHAELVLKVGDFLSDFRAGRVELTEALLDFLETWLVEHILGQDQELGDYLRARGIPA